MVDFLSIKGYNESIKKQLKKAVEQRTQSRYKLLFQGIPTRFVRDAEVAGSSPVTLTITILFQECQGVAQLVARTHGVREVVSSSLITLTTYQKPLTK